jgi:hypothetical protein
LCQRFVFISEDAEIAEETPELFFFLRVFRALGGENLYCLNF